MPTKSHRKNAIETHGIWKPGCSLVLTFYSFERIRLLPADSVAVNPFNVAISKDGVRPRAIAGAVAALVKHQSVALIFRAGFSSKAVSLGTENDGDIGKTGSIDMPDFTDCPFAMHVDGSHFPFTEVAHLDKVGIRAAMTSWIGGANLVPTER